ncbi:PAC2 family protein [Promethearchaeum syntrophicum]|uniref:PAC2 family protein n=1 Tax=Promethearchaeum syntrophicum TaxID=2594042 RepID=A0A5B9D759_9ARCH|nr:PAC2 family protein [Candidatus Prometheoarchaeum syntrophicum]QEE14845.1 PAC2 family protein [Candidatus Prometheoarchaeum syntrophicum]
MSNFRLIQFEKLEPSTLHNPLCIIGMPGIADIGKFAVDQLIGIFQARKYCEIIFNDYPAGAIVDESILSTPKAEILFHKDPKHIQDLLLITADAQAMSPRGIYEISDYIATIIQKLGVVKILALGAYPIKKNKSKHIDIYVTSTETKFINQFIETGETKLVKKGVIIGSNGLIPTLAKARFGIEGIVLLAETDNSAIMNDNMTDLQASIQLLELVSRFFSLPIKNNFSSNKIDEITQDLETKRKELEKDLENTQPHLEIAEVDKSIYI